MKSRAPRSLLLALASAFLACAGCGAYWRNRAADAHDIIDIGLSFSRRPQFALYGNFQTLTPIGYGHVDGWFFGNAGGTWGWMKYHHRGLGLLLWGEEEQAYGEHDPDDPASVNFRREGIIGLLQGPRPDRKEIITCPHIIHLGWIGVVGTGRWLDLLDFILGWTTLDIMDDDAAGGIVNFRHAEPRVRRGQGPP